MVSKTYSVAFQGIEALQVVIEVQMSSGNPLFSIVGLADKAIAESRERVRGALNSLGLGMPAKHIQYPIPNPHFLFFVIHKNKIK